MEKVISIILLSLILCPFCFAQQQMYGYKYSGKGDILSDCFFIQNGFVLDSVVSVSQNKTYSFVYNEKGKLKRDINFYTVVTTIIINGRTRAVILPGSRDYYYTVGGNVDSVGYGHWDNNNVWVSDSFGIKYQYSFDGKITSKISYWKDSVTQMETNSYDSTGNLILNKVKRLNVYTGDTTINSSEYDSLNRITLRKTFKYSNPQNLNQYVYQYDSTGNIYCAMMSISNGDTSRPYSYSFKFDTTDKIIDEIFCLNYDTLNIAFNYDESGKILNMGPVVRFHYNSDGNLDTLSNLHAILCGYLGNTATMLDSYGNTISLQISGTYNFYYSKKNTGVTTNAVTNRTFALSQNYPNPFNPITTISFDLPSKSFVSLKIFDLLGREVSTIVSQVMSAGSYSKQWDAANMSSGIYFYRLQTSTVTETKKLVLLR
jgi:hypothetical protein